VQQVEGVEHGSGDPDGNPDAGAPGTTGSLSVERDDLSPSITACLAFTLKPAAAIPRYIPARSLFFRAKPDSLLVLYYQRR